MTACPGCGAPADVGLCPDCTGMVRDAAALGYRPDQISHMLETGELPMLVGHPSAQLRHRRRGSIRPATPASDPQARP